MRLAPALARVASMGCLLTWGCDAGPTAGLHAYDARVYNVVELRLEAPDNGTRGPGMPATPGADENRPSLAVHG
jgi:hypothetical protein